MNKEIEKILRLYNIEERIFGELANDIQELIVETKEERQDRKDILRITRQLRKQLIKDGLLKEDEGEEDWISVEDELPKSPITLNSLYGYSKETGVIEVDWYNKHFIFSLNDKKINITHWQRQNIALPKPPKKQEK